MDHSTLLLLITFVCASILIFFSGLFHKALKSAKLPPGPSPFPIVGNILELGRNPHQALSNLSRIYGPVMTLKLGNITTIVISSPQVAKQVLQENGHAFSSRTVPHAVQPINHSMRSIVWLSPSAKWATLRRVCATKIFSPQQLNSTQILRERKVQELLDYIKERCKKGEALDIGEAVFTTVLNSISNFFFSTDLAHYKSDESQEFKNTIWGIMEEAGRPNVADFFPILRLFDPQGAFARMTSYFKELNTLMDGIVKERMDSRVSKADSKVYSDVLDSLLNIIEESSSQLNRQEMLHLFMDLFIAGIDTTSSTVEWTMAELLHNPEKLKKAKEELHEVLGEDVTIEESHILNLRYLQAVVKETLRLHPPAPFLVPHKCDETIEISDFIVPKNAQVLVNVWSMGRDPSIWENPNQFVPERFMENDFDYKGHDFEFIPFGAGKRICPGLPLAHRAVHLMVASLLHSYEWKLADGLMPEQMNMQEKYGLTLKRVQPLLVQAIPVKHR